MELVEIRDLDGPNMFMRRPAIKVEFKVTPEDRRPAYLAKLRASTESLGVSDDPDFGEEGDGGDGDGLTEWFLAVVEALEERIGNPAAETVVRAVELSDHVVVAFEWHHRRSALGLAQVLADLATLQPIDVGVRVTELATMRESTEPGDRPQWVRNNERRVPIIGITGTNGKTTTTRLSAHILRGAGRSVGWSSSSGVYINGVEVLEGDYTGPAGARRVLDEPGLDVAVLETARGGILLRGIAYESNDVGVFVNVSADHLDLLGVRTVEGLAAVKSMVVKVTKPGGTVVLNADDPLVRGCAGAVEAQVWFVSRVATNPTVLNHLATGGTALLIEDGMMVLRRGSERTAVAAVEAIPLTYGGRAGHMVENSLCAAAACLALGLSVQAVGDGLTTFRNSPDLNPGRLNVYDLDGVVVVVDYAHNEAGLSYLLEFGRSYVQPGRTLTTIVGTAGDRTDDALVGLGRMAAEASDAVIVRETARYLRGRADAGEMTRFITQGIESGRPTPWSVSPGEIDALTTALAGKTGGDVVVIMSLEEMQDVRDFLSNRGRPVS